MSKLSDLFKWEKEVEIKNGEQVVGKAYIKIVGDVEYQEARRYALKRSRQIRAKMRDVTSDEYASNFADIDSFTQAELINGIIIGELPDYRDSVMLDIPIENDPELPDDPTLEDQEEYEAKLESMGKERTQKITDAMNKMGEDRRAELEKLPTDELKTLYITSVSNSRAMEEFSRVFREYQIYKGVYEDKKCTKPAFDSYEDFAGSSFQLKDQLTIAYTSLEISGEDLKN